MCVYINVFNPTCLQTRQDDVEQRQCVLHILLDSLLDGGDGGGPVAPHQPVEQLLTDSLHPRPLELEEVLTLLLAQVGVQLHVELLEAGVGAVGGDGVHIERLHYVHAHRREHREHHPQVGEGEQFPDMTMIMVLESY